MPSATARRLYEDQLPSFMSILDPEADNYDDARGLVTMVDSKMVDMEPACAPPMPAQSVRQQQQQQQHQEHQALHSLPAHSLHRHHDTTSTHNDESADSSPTTTLTTDTSSLSDPSPSSSPESPVNLIPLNSFPATSFGGLSSNLNTLSVSDGMSHNALSASTELPRPMTSPSPRRRNMKGLSIQPPFQSSLTSSLVSEPTSPSFIKPTIPAMKRKPSQLSLKTDSNNLQPIPTLVEVPSSPGMPMLQRRALKHSTSSPHMLSTMKSATFGPAGGMSFPKVLERGQSGLSEFFRPSSKAAPQVSFDGPIMEEESPIRAQVASRVAMDMAPLRDESEVNEDQKSPGYPDGPIAIYDDNIFLYLEPTADEAAKFDVVINVAREVHNPFNGPAPGHAKEAVAESPVPDTARTSDSFATAFEFPIGDRPETPTTPKAMNPPNEPEYIHMPWDHNTDIATDLMTLCETIEKRTKEGKKVLVHCQQGASRSASLIIAYGLYQNPGISVNDAYYAAQSKSRWISPNMRLMYCLQDFQKEVAKKRLPLRSAAGGLKSGRSPTKHRLTLSADAIDMKPTEPLSAPLPDETPDAEDADAPETSPLRLRGKSSPSLGAISPGPSSAPSTFSWAEKDGQKDEAKCARFNLDKNHCSSPLKFVETETEEDDEEDESFPPRSSSFFKPPPPPRFAPPSLDLQPPPTPGFAPRSLDLKPPPTPGFAHRSLDLKPPPTPGFASRSLDLQPPPTPGFAPRSLDLKPPPTPGFAPRFMEFKPPPSPGFPPASRDFNPPPSPGFGAHRFAQGPPGTGLSGLNFGSLDSSFERREEAAEDHQEYHHMTRAQPDDDALMSPRAETMTNNPLHESFSDMAGMKFVEVPPSPSESSEGLFSPRQTVFPRDPFYQFGRPTQVADPRSPPTKGETPIVRSIDELL